jgi:hypothetical protein
MAVKQGGSSNKTQLVLWLIGGELLGYREIGHGNSLRKVSE